MSPAKILDDWPFIPACTFNSFNMLASAGTLLKTYFASQLRIWLFLSQEEDDLTLVCDFGPHDSSIGKFGVVVVFIGGT